ncbi:hypothetical protein IWW55_003403 [Coemansia sp. RSA 2706]|nr:hypothetical protein IWW55_003403 [Coemansia sp. RSA 2706]
MSAADFGLAPAFGRNIRKQTQSPVGSNGNAHRRRLRDRTARRDHAKANGSAPPSLSTATTLTAFPAVSDVALPKSVLLIARDAWSTDSEDGEKLGRSSSCCETQRRRRRLTRRESRSEYFDEPRLRRSSMDAIRGRQAPASEPLVCYKMARLAPEPAHYSAGMRGAASEMQDRAAERALTANEQAPTPQFLRHLDVLRQLCQAQLANSQDTGDASSNTAMPQMRSTPHYEALVNAAHMPASRPAPRVTDRLARFTRRLISSLSFSRAESPADDTGSPGPDGYPQLLSTDAVSTFNSQEQAYTVPDALDGARGMAPVSDSVPEAATRTAQRSAVTRRMHRKPPASIIAARRNVTLTIPTARALPPPPFLPGMFAIPALSPACTSLNSEAVTASATACGSVLASPMPRTASADGRACSVFDISPLEAPPLHTAPAASTSARDMLHRLASSGLGAGPPATSASQGSSPASLHASVHEEWGLFISDCLKGIDARLVPCAGSLDSSASFSGSAATAVVPAADDALPQRWFDDLDGGEVERFDALVVKGVPADFRRQVWMECAGALDMPAQGVDAYPRREEIELDLLRTASAREPDEQALRHVLYGYVAANPEVGYCQGMDKIAHGLLAAGLGAADALRMLRAVLDGIVPDDMFRAPMLGLQMDQLVLEELVSRRLPRLAGHLRGRAPLAPVTVSWFLALFVGVLPDAHRLRVWDMLFAHGYAVMFQASLAVLELCQPALLQCAAPAAVYTLLQNVGELVAAQADADEFGARVSACRDLAETEEIDAIRRVLEF